MSDDINQKVKVLKTADGSTTLFLEELNETYHSTHGAYQEAVHVFIKEGLNKSEATKPKILEVGFGTGLNAILTLTNTNQGVDYQTIEPFPLGEEVVSALNYGEFLDQKAQEVFCKIHQVSWNEKHQILDSTFIKHHTTLLSLEIEEKFDIIYFDAFAPSKQPDVWDLENLGKCFDLLKSGGFLVTYCAKGQFKRDLKSLGFVVENPPGPKGKREMTKGIKP